MKTPKIAGRSTFDTWLPCWGMLPIKALHEYSSEINVILFLDYDGVLHPDAVYRRLDGRIELHASGELFMWAPLLEEILDGYPELRIVLSTSWGRVLGFRRARESLPATLAEKVGGATWHSAMGRSNLDFIEWDNQTRFEQIATFLHRLPHPVPWLAIDDDRQGWPPEQEEHLVLTDSKTGLSPEHLQKKLHDRLNLIGSKRY